MASVAINLAVGVYFAVFYPRSLRKRFAHGAMPRGFGLLQRVVPPVGGFIIVLTILYALMQWLGR